MIIKIPYIFLLVVLIHVKLHAQIIQDEEKKIKYLAVPVVFKNPENGFAYGLSGSMSFKTSYKHDTLTRTSIVQAICFFTTKHQNVQVIDATTYFPKENYILFVQLSHSYFPDKFWGIGSKVLDKHVESYTFEQFYAYPHIKRKIVGYLFGGLQYEFQKVFNINYLAGGRFDTIPFYGKQGYKISGLGLSMSFDSRNRSFWPDKGLYLQTILSNFRKNLGGDYDIVKLITDFRFFQKLYKEHILALQLYNYITSGETSIRDFAALGGANNLRGFYQGRYRDNNMISFIAEYRLHLIGRFAVCAFGGVGDVYHSLNDLDKLNMKYSYGAGLRFALLKKEKLNIRVDYGYSNKNNNGLYVTIGECF